MASDSKNVTLSCGGIGCWIAAALSFVKWGGFWLTVGHFFCGWFYVAYFILKYTPIRHYFGF
jgi:hypothetical protein